MNLKHYLNIFLIAAFTIYASCKKDDPVTPVVTPDITTGLIAYFPLNGSAIDSVNNITATNHNVVSGSDHYGNSNGGMTFIRSDSSYLDFGNDAAYSFTNNIFTISCWVNVTDTVAPLSLISKRGITGPWEYSLDNHMNHSVFNLDNWISNGAGSVYGIDPLDASATVKLGGWHLITYTADGTALKVYEDGNVVATTDLKNAGMDFSETAATLRFGVGGNYGVNYHLTGMLDDVRFYNRALTEEQVKYLFSK